MEFTKSPWNGIEGIVIDAVGTLIDANPPVSAVYAAAAARQGVALDPAEIGLRFTRCFRHDEAEERNGPLVTSEPIECQRWRRIVSAVLPELPDPGRGFDELWEHFAGPASWFCFPDVLPALETLRALGIGLVIASNFDARLRRVIAGLPGLAGTIDALVISSEAGYRKPHPAFFSAACICWR